MTVSFEITDRPIDRAIGQHLADQASGAFVAFEGRVRNRNDGREVLRLEYEIYRPLAVKEGNRILAEAIQRYSVRRVYGIHRSGLLELGDIAVLIVVSAPYRDEAFEACRYIIDEVKRRLPIWKKEYYADGEAGWVNCQRCSQAGSN